MFVMVSGPPGAGKSTLARPIAAELELPLIGKDAIKEALMDILGYPATVEQSRTLGRAAVVAVARYTARSPTRHAGHLDADRQPDELWNEQNTSPTGIAPSIVVDTTASVDVATVVTQVKELALSSGDGP